MGILLQIILASFIVSLISFMGAIMFVIKERNIKKYLIFFVALSAGSFLGGAFFHLIPEGFESFLKINDNFSIPAMAILFGIILFYIIEKFIHWHHHHDIDCHKHSLSTLSLVGDGFHNFMDGILIASSFMVNPNLGIATTLFIIFHEIPQEIGDLAILLHSGYSKTKALMFNFLSACFSIIGALTAYFLLGNNEYLIPLMILTTAGGFIYIALADIIPELHKTKSNILIINLIFLFGLLISYILTFFG